MASLKDRLTGRLDQAREQHPWLDHGFRTVGHYGSVDGNAQAGAVTFFGFLSFFPILALAFVVVGVLAHVYPDLRTDLRTAINDLLPGVIGSDKGEIPMKTFEDAAGAVGVAGFAALLYAGLGWLSGMRSALEVMFAVPRREQPSFVKGKLLDLGTLALIGATLLLSVTLSAGVAGFSSTILGWLGIDTTSAVPQAVLWLVGHALAIAATALLFAAMFKLLVESHVPRRSLWEGAFLGAFGFELLKGLANFLLGQTKGQPAFQAFGVALILVIWINYFSRLVMYAAAYAYTSPEARERRTEEAMRAPGAALAVEGAEVRPQEVTVTPQRPTAGSRRAATADRSERDRLLTVGAVAGAAVAGVAVTRAARRRSR